MPLLEFRGDRKAFCYNLQGCARLKFARPGRQFFLLSGSTKRCFIKRVNQRRISELWETCRFCSDCVWYRGEAIEIGGEFWKWLQRTPSDRLQKRVAYDEPEECRQQPSG